MPPPRQGRAKSSHQLKPDLDSENSDGDNGDRWRGRWLDVLLGMATVLTCVVQTQSKEGLAGPLGTVCPDLVHKVLLDRNEVVASASQNLGHLLPVI